MRSPEASFFIYCSELLHFDSFLRGTIWWKVYQNRENWIDLETVYSFLDTKAVEAIVYKFFIDITRLRIFIAIAK